MRLLTTPEAFPRLSEALGHMVEALAILDEINAPGEIGSLLDHAIVKLKTTLPQKGGPPSSVQMLMNQLERELLAGATNVNPAPSPWENQPT